MKRILECVPNISEGKDKAKIDAIANEVTKVEGVKLLNVDPGRATNRTVITFAGEPEKVVEAAFLLIKKAAELIDMSKHHGEHPRMGATDVCPLVPISGITMEETVELARKLGKRVGEELGIPVYLYEYAATEEKRRNLANCRAGEYEGLKDKLKDPQWKPDFGPAEFNNRVKTTGATAIGARDFLIAYNVNLNTTSVRRANSVAFDIREKGRVKREGDPVTGKIVVDENNQPVYIPGSLKAVKAIGWYIEEYGIAQVSMNLTDINVTPLHIAFDECCKRAEARGLRVTGSEIVGLVPKKALVEAGRYFLKKQNRSTGVGEEELIRIAILTMGLNELSPFDPKKRIIEYLLEEDDGKKLIDLSVKDFLKETASESPAPGGGSISALCGSLGAALATMVANLSSHKRGWDHRVEEFSVWAEKGQELLAKFNQLIDEDTRAFNKIMDAYGLPKRNEEELQNRKQAIEEDTIYAAKVPLETMKNSFKALEVVEYVAKEGMESSVSDAGVAALCLRSAMEGAYLNVKINLKGLPGNSEAQKILQEAEELREKMLLRIEECLKIVNAKIHK